MKPNRKIPALDGLRGIAALLVVGGHTQAVLLGRYTWLGHSGFCVDFFFILSGFVVGRAYEAKMKAGMPFSQYSKIRIFRLYPLIALGALMGAVAALSGAHSTYNPIILLILQLLFIPTLWTAGEVFVLNNVQWSLLVELVVNAAHFFSAKWITSARLAFFTTLMAGTTLALARHYHMPLPGSITESFLGGMVRGGFGFSAGLLLLRLTNNGQLSYLRLHWSLVMASLPLVVALASYRILDAHWYTDPAIAIFVMPAICWAGVNCHLPERFNGVATLFGNLSYPVYALHLPILFVAKKVISDHGWQSISHKVVYACCVLSIVCASWLAEKYFDRPLQKRLGQKRREIDLPSTL